MLPVVFEGFELACIFFWLFFSFHYHYQLVKGQLYQKSRGELQFLLPPPGFYKPDTYFIAFCVNT